jgi:hypothetical protein
VAGILRDKRAARTQGGEARSDHAAGDRQRAVDLLRIEAVWLAGVGVLAAGALWETLAGGRHTTSVAVTVLVPLLALVTVQARRAIALRAGLQQGTCARWRWPQGDGIAGMALGVALFLALFLVAGHYAAVGLLVFALVRCSGHDGTARAAGVAAACTAAIFLLFDGMLGIEMWRGLFFRHAAGFQDI